LLVFPEFRSNALGFTVSPLLVFPEFRSIALDELGSLGRGGADQYQEENEKMIQVNHENDWRFGRRKREKGSLGEDPPC